MIVIIDNYDSFTYNLYQYIGEFDKEIIVYRNDEITAEELLAINPDKIVISPGPKTPNDAGNCLNIIKQISGIIPILGICLGHQCIGQVFGGSVIKASKLVHGKSSMINHEGKSIFANIENPLKVARYHSLMVEKETLPNCLEVLAVSDDNVLMAIKHKKYNVIGLQFHPESILTEKGLTLIKNFIEMR